MKKMKIISIIWGLSLMLIVIAVTIFALKWKNTNSIYRDLENKMVSATKGYYESERSYPLSGESSFVKFDELISKSLINSKEVNGDLCDGYVKVTNNTIIEYKAYLKCNKYETKGYVNLGD